MSEKFAKLDYRLIHSISWSLLSHASRTLYVAIRGAVHFYPEREKGLIKLVEVSIGHSDVRHLIKSASTFHACIKQLVERGFITITEHGEWQGRKRSVFAISDKWESLEIDLRACTRKNK